MKFPCRTCAYTPDFPTYSAWQSHYIREHGITPDDIKRSHDGFGWSWDGKWYGTFEAAEADRQRKREKMPNYATTPGWPSDKASNLRYNYSDAEIEQEYKRRRRDKDLRHAAALGVTVATYTKHRDYILENDPRS